MCMPAMWWVTSQERDSELGELAANTAILLFVLKQAAPSSLKASHSNCGPVTQPQQSGQTFAFSADPATCVGSQETHDGESLTAGISLNLLNSHCLSPPCWLDEAGDIGYLQDWISPDIL